MKRVLWAVVVIGALWVSASQPATQPVSGALTIDTLIDIKHPSAPQWSPDGRAIIFTWERAGVSALHVVAADGKTLEAEQAVIARSKRTNASWWLR